MTRLTRDWEKIAASRRAELDKQLENTGYTAPIVDDAVLDVSDADLSCHLTKRQQSITSLTPEVLLDRLAKGSFSAYEVTEAFCHRAAIAHSLINCLCHVFFERALERARQLDDEFRIGGPTGPLHGLPISLKNQLNVQGIPMDMCYVGRVGEVAAESCALVRILETQGAIPYVLTNMSQGLLSSDSVNNLYRRTLSPFNRSLCVGGSSGGEGGLIALQGSPLGVGSDLGGSIRMPAAFNGLYGFRPSSNRVPYQGAENSQQGQELNASCLGPISPSVAGLKIFFKAVLNTCPWTVDPLALRMPWREEEYQLDKHRGLCFGILHALGRVHPNPPYVRAMTRVRSVLEAAGYHTVDVALADDEEGYEIYLQTLTSDAGQDVATECAKSGEPVLGNTAANRPLKAKSAHDWWQLARRRRAYIARQLEMWQKTSLKSPTGRPVDGIIAPVSPYPSFRHGEQDYVFYTAFSNLCDYPTTTFPVGRVRPELDTCAPVRDYHNEWDRLVSERYCAQTFQGMPIGLQLIGRKGEDEAVLRLTEIVVECLETHRPTGTHGGF